MLKTSAFDEWPGFWMLMGVQFSEDYFNLKDVNMSRGALDPNQENALKYVCWTYKKIYIKNT